MSTLTKHFFNEKKNCVIAVILFYFYSSESKVQKNIFIKRMASCKIFSDFKTSQSTYRKKAERKRGASPHSLPTICFSFYIASA
jgi:hypothetical protein